MINRIYICSISWNESYRVSHVLLFVYVSVVLVSSFYRLVCFQEKMCLLISFIMCKQFLKILFLSQTLQFFFIRRFRIQCRLLHRKTKNETWFPTCAIMPTYVKETCASKITSDSLSLSGSLYRAFYFFFIIYSFGVVSYILQVVLLLPELFSRCSAARFILPFVMGIVVMEFCRRRCIRWLDIHFIITWQNLIWFHLLIHNFCSVCWSNAITEQARYSRAKQNKANEGGIE